MEKLTKDLKKFAGKNGADLVGIAPVERWSKAPLRLSPKAHMQDAKTVVVIGIHHPDASVEMGGFPSPHDQGPYSIQYCMNDKLDHINWLLGRFIEEHGYKALPIASSNIWRFRPFKELTYEYTPDICHMYAGVCAGLGEIGWNNLLLTPEYGPRQRVISMITNVPLIPSQLYRGESLCDLCMECVKHCPTDAFRKETKGKSKIEIEDRIFEFCNKNKWRCSWAECFALNLNLPIPEKIDEEVISSYLSKYGIYAGEIGYCLKYCLPPQIRGPLHTNGTPQRNNLKKQNETDSRISKITNEIANYGIEKCARMFTITPLSKKSKIAKDIYKELQNTSSLLFFTLPFPFWNCNKNNITPWNITIMDSLSGFLILDICRKIESYGYKAIHSTNSLINRSENLVGLGKIEKDSIVLRDGIRQKINLILTDAPFKSIHRAANITKKKLHGLQLFSYLQDRAKREGADLIGACPASYFDGLRRTLEKSIFPEKYSWVIESKDELNCGVPSKPKILKKILKIYNPRDYLREAKSVFVIGVRLPKNLVERALSPPAESPGPYSYAIYQVINELSFLAFKLSNELGLMGYKVVPTFDLTGSAIPVANPKGLQPGILSNRFAAVAAGLAMFGRSGVALTKEYGPHQRFITLITDAELPAKGLLKETSYCKECHACLEFCPMGAISKEAFEVHLGNRCYKIPIIDRNRCEWASRYGLVASVGPKYLGAKDNIKIPNEEITTEMVCNALRKRDAMQRPFTCIVEPCVIKCPLPS